LARIAAKALVKVEVIGGGDLILMAMSGLMLTMEYVSIFFILVGVFGTILGVTLKVRKKHSGPFPFTPIILPVLYFLLLHHYTLGHYGR
ncbi:MAG: hypothetical protein LBB24_01380, partial [Rickettsiales bacterium]|nr:hypothetical protein [Rickettsiales bacterium]